MKASQWFLGFSSHCFLLACTFFQSLVPDFSHTGRSWCQPQSHSPLCWTSRKPPPYLLDTTIFMNKNYDDRARDCDLENNSQSFIFDASNQLVNLWMRRPRRRPCGPERKRGSLWRHGDSAVISRHPGRNQGSWGAAPYKQNKALNYMLLFTPAHGKLTCTESDGYRRRRYWEETCHFSSEPVFVFFFSCIHVIMATWAQYLTETVILVNGSKFREWSSHTDMNSVCKYLSL